MGRGRASGPRWTAPVCNHSVVSNSVELFIACKPRGFSVIQPYYSTLVSTLLISQKVLPLEAFLAVLWKSYFQCLQPFAKLLLFSAIVQECCEGRKNCDHSWKCDGFIEVMRCKINVFTLKDHVLENSPHQFQLTIYYHSVLNLPGKPLCNAIV